MSVGVGLTGVKMRALCEDDHESGCGANGCEDESLMTMSVGVGLRGVKMRALCEDDHECGCGAKGCEDESLV
eukprot:scaffold25613_cov111-Isochrysis_galbana.AAC.1